MFIIKASVVLTIILLKVYSAFSYVQEFDYLLRVIDLEDGGHKEEHNVVTTNGDIKELVISKSLLLSMGELKSNEVKLQIEGAIELNGLVEIPYNSEIKTTKKPISKMKVTKEGEVTMFVLMTTGNNIDGDTLSDKIFGTDGDAVNLKKQYYDCSYGKLNFKPFIGDTITGETVRNGVGSVIIDLDASGTHYKDVEKAMKEAAIEKYGDLQAQFDYVMFSTPPETDFNGAAAYAYTNGYLSVFREVHIVKSLIQMHEVGHNLNLGHSDEIGAVYGDRSGNMGSGMVKDDYRACFNAPKSWQLMWYSDSHYSFDPTAGTYSGKIVGFSDYGIHGDYFTIIQLTGSLGDNEYYIAFNRASGINEQTAEGANQVLVHYRKSGQEYASSYLVAILSANMQHTLLDYTTSKNIVIKVGNIFISESNIHPSYADVTIIGIDKDAPAIAPSSLMTYPPTLNPTNLPTASTTHPPTLGTKIVATSTSSPTISCAAPKTSCKTKKHTCCSGICKKKKCTSPKSNLKLISAAPEISKVCNTIGESCKRNNKCCSNTCADGKCIDSSVTNN